MPRYTGWRRLVGDTDRPDLLDLGKRLLGYLEQQRANGAPKSLAVQRQAPDGSIVRARFVYDMPIIEVAAGGGSLPIPVPIDGFVTWPSLPDGTDALDDHSRVVLAGPQFKDVRKGRYAPLFPDVSDADLGTVDGLGRAGNVDWQGRGWAVSWYGPRTRYIDFDAPKLPWVFFKGMPILDVRDLANPGTYVRGACVCSAFGAPHLVVVTQEFISPSETVWALPIIGKATDARITLGEATMLDDRPNSLDNLETSHPWCFSPDGTEGRTLVRAVDAAGLANYERIIRLVADGGEAVGFRVELDYIAHARPTQTIQAGYSRGTYVRRPGNQQIVVNRTSSVDMRSFDYGPYDPDPLFGMAEVDHNGVYDVKDMREAVYYLLGDALEDWTYEENILVDESDWWQPLAVDYKPDGSVVYGYGRVASGTDVTSGSFHLDSGNTRVSVDFVDDTVFYATMGIRGDGVNWQTASRAVNADVFVPEVSAQWSYASTRTKHYITKGFKIGDLEVTSASTNTTTATATRSHARPGGTVSQAPELTSGGSARTDDPDPSYAWGFPTNAAYTVDQNVGTPAYETASIDSSSTSTTVDENLYLMRMDLRHDALFVATEQVTTLETRAYVDVTMTASFSETSGTPIFGSSGTFRSGGGLKRVWHTRGWIGGAQVLDDSLVALDTISAPEPPTETAVAPVNPTLFAGDATYTLGAARSPSELDWPLPDVTMVEFPLFPDHFYGQWPGGPLTADVPAALALQTTSTQFPFVQESVLTWQAEVEAASGEVTGRDFHNAIKVRWKRDLDGVGDAGAWAFTAHGSWAVSMALPAVNDDAHAFRFFHVDSAGALNFHVRVDNAEHFWPIWVLPTTSGFVP